MSMWAVVYAIGAAQAIILALALWKRETNPDANRLLSGFLGLSGLDLAARMLFYPAPAERWMLALTLISLLPLLHCALFYLYVRTLTSRWRLQWLDTVYAALFLILAALTAANLYSHGISNARLLEVWKNTHDLPRSGYDWFDDVMLFVYAFFCLGTALMRVRRYRRELRAGRSDADQHSLRWIDAMALGEIALWTIALIQRKSQIPYVTFETLYGALAAWVCLLGYLSLQQPAVPVSNSAAPPAAGETAITTTASAQDDDPRIPDVLARLSQLMANDALYREPALTIAQVAKRSGYPEYLVSIAINRRLGGHFGTTSIVCGSMRPARALHDPADARSVLEIAYDYGFTSKS